MGRRWQRAKAFCLVVMSLGTAGASCDSGGIGAFDRTATSQYALLASVDADGHLTIIEQREVAGVVADRELRDAGEPSTLRDPFDYDPDPGTTYLMLIAPAVVAHQDPDAGAGQYSLLYLHDPDTDLPTRSFPTGGIHGGLSPEEFLNCLRSEAQLTTRFDAVVAAVDVSETDLFSACM